MWLPSHRITIPSAYAAVLLLAALSRRIPRKIRRVTGQILLVLLLLSELIKQLEGIKQGMHSPAYYPFHYSSTFYISIALYCFGRGRPKHYGACSLFVGGGLLLAIMTYNPLAIVGDTSTIGQSWFALHGYLYHVAVLLFFAVMLANHDYRVQQLDPLRYLSFLLAWAIVAVAAARATGVNYAGLLVSWIPILERLRIHAGDGVYLTVYAAAVFVIACLWILAYGALQQYMMRRKSTHGAPTQK